MHIVIQGAGRGLGLAFAHHALRAGATKLYLTARNPQDCKGFRQLQPSEHIQWFNLDFLNPDQIASTGEAILAAAPHIDRVIVTAGVLHDGEIQPEKRVGALETEAMLHLYQVNAMGPVLFLKSLWPALRRAHPVTAASLSARVGSISDNRLGGWYSYRASKAALNQYMRTLSIELARYNNQAKIITIDKIQNTVANFFNIFQGQLKVNLFNLLSGATKKQFVQSASTRQLHCRSRNILNATVA